MLRKGLCARLSAKTENGEVSMPIYEYEREDGSVFEISQSIKDEPLSACPTTGQKVRKIISRTAFKLEGAGWYKDGYSSGPASEPAKSASPDAGTSSGSSPDSKPASSSTPGTPAKSCGSGCGCH